MALHLGDAGVPRRPGDRAHRQRRDVPGRFLRRGRGHSFPKGVRVRSRARLAPNPHRVQQRRACGLGRRVEAVLEGQVDRRRGPFQGVRFLVFGRGRVQTARAGHCRRHGEEIGWQDRLRLGRRDRRGPEVHRRGHRRREFAGQRPHRGRDVAGVQRGLHALLCDGTLCWYRCVLEQAGPARDPDGQRPYDFDGLRGVEQALGGEGVFVAGPVGWSPGDGPQWRDAQARAE
mmetsp:Transcript_91067/g.278770  ORF Transcript_91067/g.278770 Transcript_91067/m.278770 type:complete len:231 (-) Transcript_91067:1433-2125(-)